MKCTVCGKGEYRWVKGKRFVFCPECGIQVPNIDGKIKVVGRPPKNDEPERAKETKDE